MKHIKDLANPNVDRVLIYAGDHGYYWRKGGCGYTTANDAGVFTRAEAYALAGHCGPEKLVELHDVPEDHLPTLKEQIGMIREYNEALRKERDTLRAEVDRLTDLFMQVEGIQPDGELGISATKVQQWYDDSQNLMTLNAEAARLREALETLNHAAKVAISREYGSSFDEETPLVIRLLDGTCDVTDEALTSTPATAEWLAARDAQMKRLGAAEELEKAAKTLKEDLADMNPPEFASRGKVQPGYCEALQDTIDGMLDHAERLRRGE